MVRFAIMMVGETGRLIGETNEYVHLIVCKQWMQSCWTVAMIAIECNKLTNHWSMFQSTDRADRTGKELRIHDCFGVRVCISFASVMDIDPGSQENQ